ncbi:hypothetical protein BJX61DRAFT_545684 [Aspergillus egyptiacus]|nr:hypothetical protein BJX61DRAFT_545684 [Aspergillus egyptiacus]
MTPSTFTLNGWRLASALLLLTKAAQAIRLTGYNTPECEGSVVISYSLVNANQCNNIDGAATNREETASAESSNFTKEKFSLLLSRWKQIQHLCATALKASND